jgi:hypothetical protein
MHSMKRERGLRMVVFTNNIRSMMVAAATITAPAVVIFIFRLIVGASFFMATDLGIAAKLRHQEICRTMQETGIGARR